MRAAKVVSVTTRPCSATSKEKDGTELLSGIVACTTTYTTGGAKRWAVVEQAWQDNQVQGRSYSSISHSSTVRTSIY